MAGGAGLHIFGGFCNFAAMNSEESRFNTMQLVKRRLFAMRNGVVADMLRRAGSPYHIIFGVNVPQLREIAADFAPDDELARRLWADTRTRESMLLAPWLVTGRELSQSDALQWIATAVSPEAVDILCMACLRGRPWAADAATELAAEGSTLSLYAAMRLLLNNLCPDTREAAQALVTQITPSSPMLLRSIALQLADELEWLEA